MKQLIKNTIPAPILQAARTGLHGLGPWMERIPGSARIFGAPDKQVFFGYYDICPFSIDNTLLLATQAPAENISPHETNPPLTLGYYTLSEKNPAFTKFAETTTWNWQQGCRLQWLGDTGNVIYNTAEGAIISDLSGKIIKTIPFPVYSISNDGTQALTLDFHALHNNRRGYGYNNATPWDDSIRLINLETLELKIVLSMEQARGFLPLLSMKDAKHYLNHLAFSPSGQRFMVTHLWVAGNKRYSRLLVCDMNGNIVCPNNNGHTSHYAWINDDKIVIFGSHPKVKNRYYLYDLAAQTHRMIAPMINEDGHPTIIGNMMITDTYPDHFRLQHLLKYDMTSGRLKTLAKFFMPPHFTGEMRCDLHPRPGRDGSMICVDMIQDNRRALCVLKLK